MLIFEHLSKTAGTTFHGSYLPVAFAPEQRLVLRGGRDENAADLERAAALSGDAAGRLKIIAGHGAGMLRERFPRGRFITVVRDPVARALSAYLHRVFHPAWHAAHGAIDPSIMKLVDFVESDEFGEPYRNGQSRLLLGPDFQDLDDDAIRIRLAERYALVGHIERFDEFVFLLHVSEGLPICLFNSRLVQRDSYAGRPTDEERGLVCSYNAVDLRLHRIVRDDFDERCQTLSAEPSAMRGRYLRALRRYREDTHGDENLALRLDQQLTTWDGARFYHDVFGTFPTFRADSVIGEPLSLDSLAVSADALFEMQGNASATLTASPLPWAYAATRTWPSQAQGLRLMLLVEDGEMGIAVTDRDNDRRFLAQVSVGRTSIPIAVDLWPERDPGMLVLRNWAHGHFRARLFSLHTLEPGGGRAREGCTTGLA